MTLYYRHVQRGRITYAHYIRALAAYECDSTNAHYIRALATYERGSNLPVPLPVNAILIKSWSFAFQR